MSHIVRRATPTSSVKVTGEQLPLRSYKEEGIVVGSQLTLDIEPRLSLAWRVEPRYWNDGFTLMVFHSITGFCPDKYTVDLNQHGQLIIETKQDDCVTHVPEEGTHFFTFLLHKKRFFRWNEKMSVPLRFSETVPSAKVALGRTKDLTDLKEMLRRNEVGEIEHEANLNEQTLRCLRSRRKLEEFKNPPATTPEDGTDPSIREDLGDIDAIVEGFLAKKRKLSELKMSAEFQSLGRSERQTVIKRIKERFDPAEISARREQRRNQKKG